VIHVQAPVVFLEAKLQNRPAHYALDAGCPICKANPNAPCLKSNEPPIWYTRLEVHLERAEASLGVGKGLGG
jgi:hypothetical protein